MSIRAIALLFAGIVAAVYLSAGAAAQSWKLDIDKDPMTDLQNEMVLFTGSDSATVYELCREHEKDKWQYHTGIFLPEAKFSQDRSASFRFRIDDGEIRQTEVAIKKSIATFPADEGWSWSETLANASKIVIEMTSDQSTRYLSVFSLGAADLAAKLRYAEFRLRCLKRIAAQAS